MTTPYWTTAIANAVKRRRQGETPFSAEHIRRAKSWVTCACGKQNPRIPRVGIKDTTWPANAGAPLDIKLQIHGQEFYRAVCGQFPNRAEGILAKIELRGAEVVAELEAKP